MSGRICLQTRLGSLLLLHGQSVEEGHALGGDHLRLTVLFRYAK